ncbi:MAG: 1-acyl-sn-glycerol-3-phosphate acyltransferase [Deltaproteobacteria bacterium]|nr:1-acyl-sn-glycerol-3-phosphate acyltransferase [Deltaproteobacteria bacterium]
MFRLLWTNAFLFLFTILFTPAIMVLTLFDRRGGRLVHFRVAVPWAKGILKVCGLKVHVTGLENIDPARPHIYMTNHQSMLDIFALLAYIPVDFKFIVKQELMRIPILGFNMRRAGYIGIERGDPRKAVSSMKAAADRIHKGASVLIFPEGTRSVDGRLLSFKKGGFNLALKARCDIIPVAISNSWLLAPKGSFRIKKGAFHMHFGKPIPVKAYSKRNMAALMDGVREAISRQMTDSGPKGSGN